MRIGVLTSSRADFGIYLPLLSELRKDNYFKISLIVFGTHLSQQHGYTLHEIIENGFEPQFVFDPVLFGDSPTDIAKTITVRKVSGQIAVERIFPVHSPRVESIILERKGKVRQAKIYYMRERSGKSARIKERK